MDASLSNSLTCNSSITHTRAGRQWHTRNELSPVQETGTEIWQQTRGRVHGFVCGAGTGGTIAGVSHTLKHHNQHVQVCTGLSSAAQSPGADLMHLSWAAVFACASCLPSFAHLMSE